MMKTTTLSTNASAPTPTTEFILELIKEARMFAGEIHTDVIRKIRVRLPTVEEIARTTTVEEEAQQWDEVLYAYRQAIFLMEKHRESCQDPDALMARFPIEDELLGEFNDIQQTLGRMLKVRC